MKISQVFSSRFIEDIEKNLLQSNIEDKEVTIEYVDPQQFLVPERFDLLCKLYYIECRENNRDMKFAKELYKENIRVFTGGRYTENWEPEKNSIEKYFSVFDKLIDEIKVNGFDTKKSIVPVGKDNIILDGAHRTAIAIYFGIELPIVRIETKSWICDYNRFSDMPAEYLDFMAYLFMKYCKKTYYLGVIWPVSYYDPNYDLALRFIKENSKVVYLKRTYLNYNGLTQFAMHAYMDQHWAGGFEKKFEGIHDVVNERYAVCAPVTIVIIYDKAIEEIRTIKNNVRMILHGGFERIHITDTKEEALRLGKMILNENSINLLNKGYIMRYPQFFDIFLKYRENVLKNNLEDDVCVDTGAVLAIHGLRDTNDLDYLSNTRSFSKKSGEYDCHNQEYYDNSGISICVDDIIYGWFNHLYCFDIKFSSLKSVINMKRQRGEPKDAMDIKIIETMHSNCIYEKTYLKDKKKRYVMYVLKRIKRKVKNLIIKCVGMVVK